MRGKKTLTKDDKLWLKLNYPHIRTELCAIKLDMNPRSVTRIARQLGVEKTPQFLKENQEFTLHLANRARQQKRELSK